MNRLGIVIVVVLASIATTISLWMIFARPAAPTTNGGSQASGSANQASPPAPTSPSTSNPPNAESASSQPQPSIPTEIIYSQHAADWVPLVGDELKQIPVGFSITSEERGIHIVKEELAEADKKFTEFRPNVFRMTNKHALYGPFQVDLAMIVPPIASGGRIEAIGIRDVNGKWQVAFQPPGRAGFEVEHKYVLSRVNNRVELTQDDRMISGKVIKHRPKDLPKSQMNDACHFFIAIKDHGEFWVTDMKLTRPAALVQGVKRFNDFLPKGEVLPSAIAERPERSGEEVVQLPGDIVDVCLGGNGKYLIAYVPSAAKLAVIDVEQRKQIGEIPVASPDARFAAGMSSLIVATANDTLERWNLNPFAKEAETKLQPGQKVLDMSMGAAAAGPLLLLLQDSENEPAPQFLDPRTFQPLDLPLVLNSVQRMPSPIPWDAQTQLRASTGGKVFGVTTPHSSFRIDCLPDQALVSGVSSSSDFITIVAPDSFGWRIFGSGSSFFEPSFRSGTPGIPTPSVQGNYCLKASLLHSDKAGPLDLCPASARFFVNGDSKSFASLSDLDLTLPNESFMNRWSDKRLSDDKRIKWVPDLDTIITLPHTSGRVAFRWFDTPRIWRENDYKHLYVANPDPILAIRGQPLQHQLDIQTNLGPVKIRRFGSVQFGGLKVSPEGLMEWDVPADQKVVYPPYYKILLRAGDREVEHNVIVHVIDPPKNPPILASSMPTADSQAEAGKPQPRKWTDRETGRQIEARLMALEGNVIRILRADGRLFDLPLDRLSDEDQAYVRSLSETNTSGTPQ